MRDDALSQAAAQLVFSGKRPDADALQKAVRAAGSDAVGVRALWVPQPSRSETRAAEPGEGDVQAWLRELRQRADAPLACGEAIGGTGRLWIATARGGWLAPVDAASTHIRGGLAPTFADPQLVVLDARGELHRHQTDRMSLQRGIPIALHLPRPALLQLVAHGSAGPRPVAERVIPAGQQMARDRLRGGRPSAAQAAPRAACGDCPLETKLNQLRKASRVLPVRVNRLLSEVAETHARATCRAGRVVHELRAGHDPETRLAEAGIRARVVGEAMARSRDPKAAFIALTRSPSHLLTLLDPRFTDAGIAAADHPSGDACLVVLLAAWPRLLGTLPSPPFVHGIHSNGRRRPPK